MVKISLLSLLVLVGLSHSTAAAEGHGQLIVIESPSGRVKATFVLDDKGVPRIQVQYDGATIVDGKLGLQFAHGEPLAEGLRFDADVDAREHDETYSIPVGKTSSAHDHHREAVIALREVASAGRPIRIEIRTFDDGVAFRYIAPKQDGQRELVLTDELTQFTVPQHATAHLLPLNGYTTSYEKYYETKRASDITPESLLGLPVLFHLEANATEKQQVWFAITEADLTDYAGLYLAPIEAQAGSFAAKLSPLPGRKDGAKVVAKSSLVSPWRVVMVAGDPGRLLESNIVFHLNPPSKIKDASWIKPGKTTFPWWNGYAVEGDVDFEPGVNTATMKYYIDFCAEQGIPYHSLDGLDIAWYGGPIHPKGPVDLTKAAPSIDMPELLRYAKEKGVRLRLWMHWLPLKEQIDKAFATYEQWGIEGVMVDFMDRDDQEMVRFYHEMAEKAARHHLTLTLHGAYKPTGMERTWPNVLTYEAALNQEYNKWQPLGVHGTPPEHNLDIAFVRMLAGPLDYHQGGVRNVLPENYKWRDRSPPVQGTRGHQLAMYVIYQNHLPMMADDPNAYRGEAGLKFMVDVPCTWDETRVLHAEFGKALVIARRSGDIWYIGGMAGRGGAALEFPMKFLAKGNYEVELLADDIAGGPRALLDQRPTINAEHTFPIAMAPSGGFVATLRPSK